MTYGIFLPTIPHALPDLPQNLHPPVQFSHPGFEVLSCLDPEAKWSPRNSMCCDAKAMNGCRVRAVARAAWQWWCSGSRTSRSGCKRAPNLWCVTAQRAVLPELESSEAYSLWTDSPQITLTHSLQGSLPPVSRTQTFLCFLPLCVAMPLGPKVMIRTMTLLRVSVGGLWLYLGGRANAISNRNGLGYSGSAAVVA